MIENGKGGVDAVLLPEKEERVLLPEKKERVERREVREYFIYAP
jgi:hypothetical protein